jgi:endonuclease/exonuclease/phosphatase family metal-dependent hydrolase
VKRVRVLTALVASAIALGGLVGAASPSQAATLPVPDPFTAVSAVPGPGPGQITLHWSHDGKNTSYYVLQTALSLFAQGTSGRDMHYFDFPAGARSATLTAAQVASAGASAGSANHLYYRFVAGDGTGATEGLRYWPYQQSVAVQPTPPNASGTPLRVASYNVRSAAIADSHTWLHRAPLVAAQIIAGAPNIVSLQELGPGRADGVSGPSAGHTKQTTSLLETLAAQHGIWWRLVRTTSYTDGVEGSQGARILYDSSRYTLQSSCPQTTNGHSYSSSCTILMPMLSTDASTTRSRAAFAQFQDKASGKQFIVVSVHLDSRHSATASTEQKYDALRATQLSTVMAYMNSVNRHSLPLVMAGDFNAWQYNAQGDRSHDALIANGYYDTASATTQVNVHYSTFNNFATTLTLNVSGWNARLDVIGVKFVTGAARFQNLMKVTDSNRPSDHNMIEADIYLP